MFKIGDWVQITPKPDLRWKDWYNSQDIYQEYLDKVGCIEFIADDDERPGEFLYAVKVDFPNGLGNLGSGQYYEWFRQSHLIKSSKSLANLKSNMAIAGKELQEWEIFKKKSTDDMLRHVFAPEEPAENKNTEKQDDPNQWDLKTPADPNYQYDDKYDSYYPDYNSLKTQYTNNTDQDYSYYYDTGNDDDQKD